MELIKPSRRGFLLGLLAAPVIVKASSLMAIKSLDVPPLIITSAPEGVMLNTGEFIVTGFDHFGKIKIERIPRHTLASGRGFFTTSLAQITNIQVVFQG